MQLSNLQNYRSLVACPATLISMKLLMLQTTLLWQDYLGTEIAVLNGNGLDGPTVSRADYLLWKNQFVASQPDWTAAIAVPEPTQLPLVLVAAGLLPWRVRIQQTRTPLRSLVLKIEEKNSLANKNTAYFLPLLKVADRPVETGGY